MTSATLICSSEINENPPHFIHEINTIAYDVSDVNLFPPPHLNEIPPPKNGLTGPSYTTIVVCSFLVYMYTGTLDFL